VYFQKDNCFHQGFSIPWVSKVDNFNIQDGKHACESVLGDLLSVSILECGTICILGQIFNNSQKRPKHQTNSCRHTSSENGCKKAKFPTLA